MIHSLLICMVLSLSCAFHRSLKPKSTLSSSLFTCFGSSSGSNDGAHQRLERIISNRGPTRDHHLLTSLVNCLPSYLLGIGSRLEVSKLFRQGRVTINGKVVLSGKTKYPLGMALPSSSPSAFLLILSLIRCSGGNRWRKIL